MTDHTTIPDNDSPPLSDEPSAKGVSHDLSMKTTPEEWFEAERESPSDAEVANTRMKPTHTVMPTTRKSNPGTLLLSAILATMVGGAFWMAAELLGLFESPWLAVPVGVLIALIIRTGAGREDPEGRATVSAIVYLLTLLIVAGLLTRREIYEIYGGASDVLLLEENLFRRRFSRLEQIAAYAIGWAVTWLASSRLRG